MEKRGEEAELSQKAAQLKVHRLSVTNEKLQLENEILKRKLEEHELLNMEAPRIRALEEHVDYLQRLLRNKEEKEAALVREISSLQETIATPGLIETWICRVRGMIGLIDNRPSVDNHGRVGCGGDSIGVDRGIVTHSPSTGGRHGFTSTSDGVRSQRAEGQRETTYVFIISPLVDLCLVKVYPCSSMRICHMMAGNHCF